MSIAEAYRIAVNAVASKSYWHHVSFADEWDRIIATIRALLEAIGQMTGYHGLPGEDA